MEKEVQCPWCGNMVITEKRIIQRRTEKVAERNCPDCGKIIACYPAEEPFFSFIRERVLTFKD